MLQRLKRLPKIRGRRLAGLEVRLVAIKNKGLSARLNRLLKNSRGGCFVSGHDFSRADKLLVFDLSEANFSSTSPPVRVFRQPVKKMVLREMVSP